jgi:ABC-type transport system involved in multi-copper enzyme maturation permease subunit
MRIGLLVRNETLKTTRRLGAWVTFLSFGGIASLIIGERYYFALRHPEKPFALPDAWSGVMGDIGPLPAIFGAVALILLITSEFSWKTARQNVIDGLSKNEFFVGKLVLYPLVALSFLGLLLFLTGGMAALGTDVSTLTSTPIRRVDLALIGGVTLTALGYMGLAFLAAFLARSSGPAMGVFFLYLAFLEQTAGGLMSKMGETATKLAGFLPRQVFDSLFDERQFDLVARQASIDAAVKAGRAIPTWHDTWMLLALAAAWIVTLVALAYWSYRRRDL